MTTISLICKKRLLGDMKLLKRDPHQYIDVSPDDKDILTWFFLIKGPDDSDYKNGYFIGKIMYTSEYPAKPPDFMMLTPSGRFDIGKKICLSNTGYHSSEWSPMWTMHATLTGFLSIMLDDSEHGISHIHQDKSIRQSYSNNSVLYNKQHYPDLIRKFTRFIDSDGNPTIELTKKTIKEPTKELVTEPVTELVTELTKEVVTELVTEPTKEVVTELVAELVTEPTKEVVTELVTEPIKESVTEQITEPVTEQITEPIKTKTKPIKRPVTKPIKGLVNKKVRKSIIFDPTTLEITKYTKTDEEYKSLMKNNI